MARLAFQKGDDIVHRTLVEQIDAFGIGNGISLIIFAGIIAAIPSALTNTFSYVRQGELGVLVLLFLAVLMVAVVATIVFVERGQRRIPVQYARSVFRGGRMYRQSGQSFIHLRVNSATTPFRPRNVQSNATAYQ